MRLLLAFVVSLLLSTIALSAPFAVHADVTWQAVGSPGFVKIDGKDGKAICALDANGLGICDCVLGDFTTGIGLRDKHMRERYLDTAKYPRASLKVESAANGVFSGKLSLKGVTRPVSGKYTLQKGLLEASFAISLDDYGIGVPSYLGVTVAKDVTVTVVGGVQ